MIMANGSVVLTPAQQFLLQDAIRDASISFCPGSDRVIIHGSVTVHDLGCLAVVIRQLQKHGPPRKVSSDVQQTIK